MIATLARSGVFLADAQMPKRIGFLFPGHGSAYLDMAADVGGVNGPMRDVFAEVDDAYAGLTGGPLTDRVWSAAGATAADLRDPEVVQPAIYAVSVAWQQLVRSMGFTPRLVLGHSLGEYAALTAASSLQVSDGVRAVYARAACLKALPRASWGAMAAVVLTAPAQARDLQRCLILARSAGQGPVDVAVDNAANVRVIAGTETAVARSTDLLRAAGIAVNHLSVSHGFHSPVLADAVEPLRERLSGIAWRTPEVTVLSSVLGGPYTAADIADLPTLLAYQLITPFSFRSLVDVAVDSGVDTFLEVGPRSVLSGLVARIRPDTLALSTDVPGLTGGESIHRLHSLAVAEGLSCDSGAESAPTTIDEAAACALVARLTGYPPELVRPDRPLVTGLGIPPRVLLTIKAQLKCVELPVASSRATALADPTVRELISGGRSGLAPLRQTVDPPAPPAVPEIVPFASPIRPAPLEDIDLEATVTAAIAEVSGYPVALIELDADLEADLGIDSIKRAAVLARLGSAFGLEVPETAGLTSARSITQWLQLEAAALEPIRTEVTVGPAETTHPATVHAPVQAPPATAGRGASGGDLLGLPANPRAHRYVPVPVESPWQETNTERYELDGRTVVVISGPDQEFAETLRGRLVQRCRQVSVVFPDGAAGADRTSLVADGSSVIVDWDDPDSAANALAQLHRELGQIDILINLSGLGRSVELELSSPRLGARLDRICAATLLSAQEYAPDLARVDAPGMYLAATGLGGVFGQIHDRAGDPLAAAVSGFTKSLSCELPEVRVKVVDLTQLDPGSVARVLVTELTRCSPGEGVEVGYHADQRFNIKLVPVEPDGSPLQPWRPPHGSVVLVAGGARGIAMECVVDLAQTTTATIVVLGRTGLLDPDDPWGRMPEHDWVAGKETFLAQQRARDPLAVPRELMQAYEARTRSRDLRLFLQRVGELPTTVLYRQCDVADRGQVRSLVREVRAGIGPISAIVYAAGEQSLGSLVTKSLAHFQHVVAVKALGLVNLWEAASPDPPARILAFGSLSGRFGMDGQTDYAAASDLLASLTRHISATAPTVACTVDWTAWDDVGMATHSSVRTVQERRGLAYMPAAEGVHHFRRELALGCRPAEVVLTGSLGANVPAGQVDALNESMTSVRTPVGPSGQVYDRVRLPLLDRVRSNGTEVRAEIHLDTARHRFLADHIVRGLPTFPGVMQIEAQAQAASVLVPTLSLQGITDIDLAAFLRVRPGRASTAWVEGHCVGDQVSTSLHAQFVTPNGNVVDPDRLHSSMRIHFGTAPAASVGGDLPEDPDLAAELDCGTPIDLARYYDTAQPSIRFGPTLRAIRRAAFCEEATVVQHLDEPSTAGVLRDISIPSFMTAPILMDNAGRGALMWAIQHLGWHIVPTAIASAVVWDRPLAGESVFTRTTVTGVQDHTVRCEVVAVGQDGRILLRLLGIELAVVHTIPGGPVDLRY